MNVCEDLKWISIAQGREKYVSSGSARCWNSVSTCIHLVLSRIYEHGVCAEYLNQKSNRSYKTFLTTYRRNCFRVGNTLTLVSHLLSTAHDFCWHVI
jgi:hypothetical protein